MKISGTQNWNTEKTLNEAISKVKSACIAKRIYHLSHKFADDPKGYFALVTTFVVCPDELARGLHAKLDQAVGEYMKENGVTED
jgi:hypothetical protein